MQELSTQDIGTVAQHFDTFDVGNADFVAIGYPNNNRYPARQSVIEEAGLKKVIITGSNGVGKSHFAAKLALVRPEVPVISFDAIKLQKDWRQHPRAEIDAALAEALEKEAWILEGGPSLLAQAVENADVLVWLDPPEHIRAWRLATRPWKHRGKTRSELPPGNIDWPWQQYKFAFRSLKNRSKFRTYISEVFSGADGLRKWRCRNEGDRVAFITKWANDLN